MLRILIADDHEVARLKARGHRIDVAESRRQPCPVTPHVKEPVDMVEGVFHQTADGHKLRDAATLADRVDELLGAIERGRNTASRLRAVAARLLA